MQDQKNPIFRSESWRRYLTRQEAAVFPRLVTPRNFAFLWLLLAAVIAISLMILFNKAPVYSPGTAIAFKRGDTAGEGSVFVVLAPGKPSQAFKAGGTGSVFLAENQPPVTGTITEIENTQIGLSEAISRFGLPAEACSTIRFPAAVLFLRITEGGHDLFRPGNQSNVYKAQVQHGTQRAISYVISATTH